MLTGRAGKLLRNAVELGAAYRDRRDFSNVVIHRSALTERLPPWLVIRALCSHVRGQLRCPENLTILFVHNYSEPPLAERALQYVGIDRYTTLKIDRPGQWRNSSKVTAIFDYLERGECKTEFILYLDSCDALVRTDPTRAIRLLEEAHCDLLVSSTTYDLDYRMVPDLEDWALAHGSGDSRLFPNTGVWVGRASFVREVLAAASEYVHADDLASADYNRILRDSPDELKKLIEYPHRTGSDQSILRFLHPRFHPRMQIDFAGELALR